MTLALLFLLQLTIRKDHPRKLRKTAHVHQLS